MIQRRSPTIEADDNVLPKPDQRGFGLHTELGTKPGVTVRTKNPIPYRVTVKDLTGVEMSGSGSVKAQGMTLKSLGVDISGSGTVNLSGSAVEQHIQVPGSGRYEAADLLSEKASVEISGSGEVAVAVGRELKIDISGSGTVTYSGNPSVQQDISGSGKVIKK